MVANFRVYGNISPIVFAQKTHLLMHRNKILGGKLDVSFIYFYDWYGRNHNSGRSRYYDRKHWQKDCRQGLIGGD
jgi:hypothetical protein